MNLTATDIAKRYHISSATVAKAKRHGVIGVGPYDMTDVRKVQAMAMTNQKRVRRAFAIRGLLLIPSSKVPSGRCQCGKIAYYYHDGKLSCQGVACQR